jgi:excisionase family DNA binding protein
VGESEDPCDVVRVNEVFQGYATGRAHLADLVAAKVIDRLAREETAADEWLDTRGASEYLGIHLDSLRRLAAERAIAAEQAGVGCKLFFRRSDLDAWRGRGPAPLAGIRSGHDG